MADKRHGGIKRDVVHFDVKLLNRRDSRCRGPNVTRMCHAVANRCHDNVAFALECASPAPRRTSPWLRQRPPQHTVRILAALQTLCALQCDNVGGKTMVYSGSCSGVSSSDVSTVSNLKAMNINIRFVFCRNSHKCLTDNCCVHEVSSLTHQENKNANT